MASRLQLDQVMMTSQDDVWSPSPNWWSVLRVYKSPAVGQQSSVWRSTSPDHITSSQSDNLNLLQPQPPTMASSTVSFCFLLLVASCLVAHSLAGSYGLMRGIAGVGMYGHGLGMYGHRIGMYGLGHAYPMYGHGLGLYGGIGYGMPMMAGIGLGHMGYYYDWFSWMEMCVTSNSLVYYCSFANFEVDQWVWWLQR